MVTFVSMGPVTSMQMKRRLPLGSDNKSFWFMVPMKEGIPPHLTDGAAVGFAPRLATGFCSRCFQETLLVDADLVELIDVDERKRPRLRSLPACSWSRCCPYNSHAAPVAAKCGKGGFPEPRNRQAGRKLLFPCCRSIPRQCATMPRNQQVEQLLPMRIVARNGSANAWMQSFPSQRPVVVRYSSTTGLWVVHGLKLENGWCRGPYADTLLPGHSWRPLLRARWSAGLK